MLIDENLPLALAKALTAIFDGVHEVQHLRQRYGPSVTDTEWIKDLHKEGGWVVISGDRRITRNRAEQQLFKSSNLVGFFLSKGLNKAPITKKMERLMALWPTIEKQVGLVSGGAMFELPMASTKLKQV
ncbi:hypothetical protein ACGYLX_18950 [Sulfitobacter sp. 1A13496]|uniref:PIN-like domain-containing protein n=1 Tax=Sulfitobacter sp. 1A13496 TaxID=3368596 RepID=UPI00374636B8